MEWLPLAVLGIMWVAFLLPIRSRASTPQGSVGDFERRMELLAQAETHGTEGRWIVTPRKGVRFMGPAERTRARARERRRQVFTFMLEAIGITFLIGLVPPLRVAVGSVAVGSLRCSPCTSGCCSPLSIARRPTAPLRTVTPGLTPHRRGPHRRRVTSPKGEAPGRVRASMVSARSARATGCTWWCAPAKPPLAPDRLGVDLDDLIADLHSRFDAHRRRS